MYELGGGLGVGGVGGGDRGVGDEFGVGVHRGVALVAVEATCGGFVAVAGVGVHRGDDPVRGDAPRDHEPPVGVLAQVLPADRGQQLRSLAESPAELAALQPGEHRRGVRAQRVHQLRALAGVVPVAHRPAAAPIVATQARAGVAPAGCEHRADGAVQHRDSVLGRDRVIDRHRVQHPPPRQRPRLAGRAQHRFEDPPRPLRRREPRPHPHQHRAVEPAAVHVEAPARITPTRVELERGHRLTLRQPEPALQHHHHSNHPRRHTAPPPRTKEIIEHPVGKQPPPLTRQHRKNRIRRQPLPHEMRTLEQIHPTRLHTHRHDTNLPTRPNNIPATLPHTHPTPPEKNTSHLGGHFDGEAYLGSSASGVCRRGARRGVSCWCSAVG